LIWLRSTVPYNKRTSLELRLLKMVFGALRCSGSREKVAAAAIIVIARICPRSGRGLAVRLAQLQNAAKTLAAYRAQTQRRNP
jgi:hypothetical protein